MPCQMDILIWDPETRVGMLSLLTGISKVSLTRLHCAKKKTSEACFSHPSCLRLQLNPALGLTYPITLQEAVINNSKRRRTVSFFFARFYCSISSKGPFANFVPITTPRFSNLQPSQREEITPSKYVGHRIKGLPASENGSIVVRLIQCYHNPSSSLMTFQAYLIETALNGWSLPVSPGEADGLDSTRRRAKLQATELQKYRA